MFKEIAILGPGLLGGSLALALQETANVRVWGRNPDVLAEVESRKMAALATTDLSAAVADADLVIFCTPVRSMAALAQKILPQILPDALLTDVGSVKEEVLRDIAPIFSDRGVFIGSHPMAGSEKSGLSAARADLFAGAVCILTPDADAPRARVAELAQFWRTLGCTTCEMSAAEHDRQIARISHLPHLAAAALLHAAAAQGSDSFALAGRGMRDATRIAAGPPEMWSEILLSNQQHLLSAIPDLIENLQKVADFLQKEDQNGLRMFLTEAATLRDSLALKPPDGRT